MRYASHSISTWITALLTVITICLFAPADAKPMFQFHWTVPTVMSGMSGHSP